MRMEERGHLPWRRRFLWRRAALRRFMRQAARMLTRTATPKKQTPPTTPANTGWGRRPGSCVREGYTSRPGQRDRKEGQPTVYPHITSSNSPSRWVLTRGGDVGYVAGTTDIVISECREAELIESILGMRGGGP